MKWFQITNMLQTRNKPRFFKSLLKKLDSSLHVDIIIMATHSTDSIVMLLKRKGLTIEGLITP